MSTRRFLKSYQWCEDDYKGKLQIRVWCMDRDDNKCLLVIPDFPVFIYIQPPNLANLEWNATTLSSVLAPEIKKLNRNIIEVTPVKKKLTVFTNNESTYLLRVTLPSRMDGFSFAKAAKSTKFTCLRRKKVLVLESDIKNYNKLAACKKIDFSKWFSANCRTAKDSEKISDMDREYIASYKSLKTVPPEECANWKTHMKVLSMDIETYSHNHNAFPDSGNPEDCIYMISCVYEEMGKPETRKIYIIFSGECNKIDRFENLEIIQVFSEEGIISAYAALVKKLDPTHITGYNINNFDFPYIVTRMSFSGKPIPYMGHIKGRTTIVKRKDWNSKAYGDISITFINVEGIVTFDLYTMIKRDYSRLRSMRLGYVAEKFLGVGKEEMTAKEMFRIFKQQQDGFYFTEVLEDIKSGRELNYEEVAKRLSETTLLGRKAKKLLKYMKQGTFYDRYVNRSVEYEDKAREEMTRLIIYCIVDSLRNLELFIKFNCDSILESLSSVSCVNQEEIYNSGQQASTYSLIHRYAYENSMVIRKPVSKDTAYEGGYVCEPILGLHDNVGTLDFNSLYPSVMIAHNLCYTTIIPNSKIKFFKKDTYNTYEVQGEKVYVVKREVYEGFIPMLLKKLLGERKAVRKPIPAIEERLEQAKLVGDEAVIAQCKFELVERNSRQLALKVKCNSVYGFMGVPSQTGIMPYKILASTVTSISRESIKLTAKILQDKYNIILVYGDTDSVMVQIQGETYEEVFRLGKIMEEELNGIEPGFKDVNGKVWPEGKKGKFPDGMRIELEEVKAKIACIGKKYYIYVPYNKDGSIDYETVTDCLGTRKRIKLCFKGCPPAKSGTPKIVSDLYKAIGEVVVNKGSYIDCIKVYEAFFREILSGQVPDADFSKSVKMGQNYSNETFELNLLAQRMMAMGRPIESGEKVETVVVDIEDKYKGNKMMVLDMLDKTEYNIDYEYYVSKAFKTVDTEVNACYKDVIDEYGSEIMRVGRKRPTPKSGISQCIFKAYEHGDYNLTQYRYWISDLMGIEHSDDEESEYDDYSEEE
uniref:DNA-directed DNA polymerase n=1 Tax=viral metagenome TaxID=1070528 RepID=A0A6C0JS69_9ZZZZ